MRRYLPTTTIPLGLLLAAGFAAPPTLAQPTSAVAAQTVASTATPAFAPPVAPAARPPMGWNSWNAFHCADLNETLVRQMADAIVSRGLLQAGYQYVNLDDCWMATTRDASGNLQADATKFPHGIADLADYVHGKGLKLGIYESAGTETCEHRPGSLDHETADAATFAAWGIDFLKYDNCGNQGQPDAQRYRAMGDALKATGRPIVYSLCNWGLASPWLFGPDTGAVMWRTTGDIDVGWSSVLGILDQQAGLELFGRPSRWNDPDMLEVGVVKQTTNPDGSPATVSLTATENIAHFSLWALLNAPLILGTDVRGADAATLSVITNPDVIAVDQDWGGSQGRRLRDLGNQEIWAKPMSDGSVAVVLLNRDSTAATVTTSAAEVGLAGSGSYALRDLWSGSTTATTGVISASVPGHGAVMLRVSRTGAASSGLGDGSYQLGDLAWSAQSNGWGPAERNLSNGETAAGDGRTMNIGGVAYASGIGAHADSGIHVYLGRTCSSLVAGVGVDTEKTDGSVRFAVYGDGRLLAYTDRLASGRAPVALTVPVAGVADLELRVTDDRDGNVNDHADWGGAAVTCTGTTATARGAGDAGWSSASNGWGPAERNLSNGETAAGDGNVITLAGASYVGGIGAHAASDIALPVTGCTRFTALVGVDAEQGGRGSVAFSLMADGVLLWSTGTITADAPVGVDAPIAGHTTMHLVVADGGDGNADDHADWAGAVLSC